ncbi:LOW QUALITY PROTEIN: hypothetical protein CRUP_014749 [Coryphaenoides rupestris]|nr:LOW QUALITY PROTEIN: hypothetical protein CRUP_014749 [Coryphaenoides rupestris]
MPGQMQEGFGCAITNRFDQLFDDESDPFELLKQAEAKKKEAAALAAAKPAVPAAAKPPKKESQKDRKTPLADKKDDIQAPVLVKKDGMRMRGMGRRPEGEGPRPQGGPVEGRGPADRRPVDRRPPRRYERPAGEGAEKPEGGEFSVEKPVGDRPMRGRGVPRGARGGRGRGLGRSDGFDARGKREFDRHSGSDRSGELDQSNVTEENPEGEEHPPADSENKENEAEEVKEDSPKEMSLDEWKAAQDKERAKVEFNIRKPNEGADWKKGYVLHKSKKEEEKGTLIEADADEGSKAEDEHRKPANDITSQLEINFGDLGRPGRGRGGPRGEVEVAAKVVAKAASGVSVPNVDDPEAFPALA